MSAPSSWRSHVLHALYLQCNSMLKLFQGVLGMRLQIVTEKHDTFVTTLTQSQHGSSPEEQEQENQVED